MRQATWTLGGRLTSGSTKEGWLLSTLHEGMQAGWSHEHSRAENFLVEGLGPSHPGDGQRLQGQLWGGGQRGAPSAETTVQIQLRQDKPRVTPEQVGGQAQGSEKAGCGQRCVQLWAEVCAAVGRGV